MMVHTKVIIIIVLAVIAILFSTILIAKGLINVTVPISTYGEKNRFLKSLTCSYAMCARDGCDSVIIDIGFLDKINDVSCYKVCNEWEKLGFTGHKCGSGFKIQFVLDEKIQYNANYPTCVWPCLSDSYRRLDTDISNFNYNWESKILAHNEFCFSNKNEKVMLDGYNYDRGCVRAIVPSDNIGLCEGILMRSSAFGVSGCGWGDKSGNLIPKDRASEDCALNTGHIWIGPNLEANCQSFENSRYFGNCTFSEQQKIDIWTEKDTIDVLGLGTYYCPELILCAG